MTGPGTTLASVLLVASGWAVVLAGVSGSDGEGAAKPKSGLVQMRVTFPRPFARTARRPGCRPRRSRRA